MTLTFHSSPAPVLFVQSLLGHEMQVLPQMIANVVPN
jgi:hypothetical protein